MTEEKNEVGRAGRLVSKIIQIELAVCQAVGLPAFETKRRLRARYRAMQQAIRDSEGKRWELPKVSRSTWYRGLRQVAGYGVRQVKSFPDRRQVPLFR